MILILVILLLWLTGFLTHVGGDLIHVLLLVALIVLVYRLLTGARPE